MSFQNFKRDSYFVGSRHRSATVKFYGDLTTKDSKILIVFCSVCNRKKSLTVSDNTKKLKVSVISSKILVKKDLTYQKRWQKWIE